MSDICVLCFTQCTNRNTIIFYTALEKECRAVNGEPFGNTEVIQLSAGTNIQS